MNECMESLLLYWDFSVIKHLNNFCVKVFCGSSKGCETDYEIQELIAKPYHSLFSRHKNNQWHAN